MCILLIKICFQIVDSTIGHIGPTEQLNDLSLVLDAIIMFLILSEIFRILLRFTD